MGMERGTVSNENCDLLTVEEVAKLLRVPTSWVYEKSSARTQERLPHVKLGKYLRFYKVDVLNYVEKMRREKND